ncbi:unnamed protein product, partial [Staurois parvus]
KSWNFIYTSDNTRGSSHTLVQSAGNVFHISPIFIYTSDNTRGSSHTLVQSAGNVFHVSPIFIYTSDNTRGSSCTLVQSAGNVFHVSPIFIYTSDNTRGSSRTLVQSAGNVFHSPADATERMHYPCVFNGLPKHMEEAPDSFPKTHRANTNCVRRRCQASAKGSAFPCMPRKRPICKV